MRRIIPVLRLRSRSTSSGASRAAHPHALVCPLASTTRSAGSIAGRGSTSARARHRTIAQSHQAVGVRGADLITGMAPGYVAGMLGCPRCRQGVDRHADGSAAELNWCVRSASALFRTGSSPDLCRCVALLPAGVVVLGGIEMLVRETAPPRSARRLRIRYVGTEVLWTIPKASARRAIGQRSATWSMTRHPHRIDIATLNHLEHSNGPRRRIERTALYASRRSSASCRSGLFAMLHAGEAAVDMVARARAGRVLTLRIVPCRLPSSPANCRL